LLEGRPDGYGDDARASCVTLVIADAVRADLDHQGHTATRAG
jgi:hypothetical protein